MSSLLARVGRHRQRYENHLRLVSGCIPYRITEDEEDHNCDLESRIEVLMVSSPDRDDLVFPKGGWEDDETVREAACREALEEAGVRGILKETELGMWEFRSKSKQNLRTLEGGCRGYMFALEVTEELENWPEQGNRDRKWLKVQEAFELCRYEWMQSALKVFVEVMAETERRGEIMEAPCSIPVPDRQLMPPNCFVKPPTTTHHDIGALFWDDDTWHIPLKRVPLT